STPSITSVVPLPIAAGPTPKPSPASHRSTYKGYCSAPFRAAPASHRRAFLFAVTTPTPTASPLSSRRPPTWSPRSPAMRGIGRAVQPDKDQRSLKGCELLENMERSSISLARQQFAGDNRDLGPSACRLAVPLIVVSSVPRPMLALPVDNGP